MGFLEPNGQEWSRNVAWFLTRSVSDPEGTSSLARRRCVVLTLMTSVMAAH